MIVIIDYQAGNSASVSQALTRLGFQARISNDPELVSKADRLIFPGVGAAGAAMESLQRLELIEPLRRSISDRVPFLGICLGYQLLFEHTSEDETRGLGILPGKVVPFFRDSNNKDEPRLKIPHMGWNQVYFESPHCLWNGVENGSEFYFVHSYYPEPQPESGLIQLFSEYGVTFAAGVVRDSLAGFQFHPEKSGRIGLRVLDNFCRWQP